MGWFDDQIKQRKEADERDFSRAFSEMADSFTGRSRSWGDDTGDAMSRVLAFYRTESREIPENVTDPDEKMEFLLRPSGIMRRTVRLTDGWYKDASGPMLGYFRESGKAVALIPRGTGGYCFVDPSDGKKKKVGKKSQALFEEEALAFYKPLPLRKTGIRDFIKYIIGTIMPADLILIAAVSLLAALFGILTPKLTRFMFSEVAESGQISLLLTTAVFSLSVSLSVLLVGVFKTFMTTRINSRTRLAVESAAMMRILSLPADFFREYSSGDLAERLYSVQSLCEMLVSVVMTTGLTSVFSLVYVPQIFAYAPALGIPALIIILATVALSITTTAVQMKISRKSMEISGKESGMVYDLLTGVQKIRLSGAEKRAFSRWARLYSQSSSLTYNPPVFIKLNSALSLMVSLAGTLVMYYLAAESKVSVADYYAFTSAYGMVSGAFSSLTGIALTVAQIKPVFERVKPILDAEPEVSEGKTVLSSISGGIELNNVSFRYSESSPMIIDDLSLKIRPGQYVAIVGKTGSGKSTLVRLLLGLEKPCKGAIYYDGKDLASVDLRSLRRKIGTVMQNGKLFSGDIFSNIAISAPDLTLDEAWAAAEIAGIADDIRKMPMGMNTIISEGSGGVSGGQRQRLVIARAVAAKPKILIFDEATSALDNVTQKKVSEALDGLKCTRIVIAHRLSTIKHCDRIVAVDGGKIIEDGTYDSLIEKGGFFADLVARQRLDTSEKI